MRTIILLLMLSLSLTARGQTLPTAVDNSQYFPPAIDQQGPSCTHVAMIYYLKSSIWNRQFNRDPKLPENQFSYGFVWGQNMHPVYQTSDPDRAVYFMQRQGCATVSDYPLNWENAGSPSVVTRERALAFKSSSISGGDFLRFNMDPSQIAGGITALKQALADGKNFVLGFDVFPSFGNMTSQDNVYDCYSGTKSDSLWYKHMAVVVGYDDNIKTAQGQGAFLVLNSSTKLPGGLFYLDYNWFYFYRNNYQYYFLEENFSSNVNASLNLNLSGSVSSLDAFSAKNIFLEPGFDLSGSKVDFSNFFDYLCARNYIQVTEINGQKMSGRSDLFIFPLNNTTGDFSLLSDLTGVISENDFSSFSLVIFDPISASYKAADNSIIYSYSRSANSQISSGEIHFFGANKRFQGVVTSLPDTTVTAEDFSSIVAGLNLKPQQQPVYVKSCTSTVKRHLITFSKNQIPVDNPPSFTTVPAGNELSVQVPNAVTFQFAATDPEGKAISYSIVSGTGATINATTGMFSYTATAAGTFAFTVRASDGVKTADYAFTVQASKINQAPTITNAPKDTIKAFTHEAVPYQFTATDSDGDKLVFSLVNPIANTFLSQEGFFSFFSEVPGNFNFKVKVSDGQAEADCSFVIKTANFAVDTPPVFTKIPVGNCLEQEVGITNQFNFEAADPEGKAISYSIVSGVGATINSGGVFNFKSDQPGDFVFIIRASDGTLFTDYRFTVTVKPKAIDNPPVFTEFPAESMLLVQVPNIVTFQFVATDPEGKAVSYSIVSGAGAVINELTGLFSYQAVTDGDFIFMIRASDGTKIVDRALTVRVSQAVEIDVPEFTVVPAGYSLLAHLPDLLTFQFVAKDLANNPMTYSIVSGVGANIDLATGFFSYQTRTVGKFQFTIRASNGVKYAEVSFTITVDVIDAVGDIEESPLSLAVYPNPLGHQAVIEVVLPETEEIRLEMFSINGKLVSVIAQGEYYQGKQLIEYDSSVLISGLYICRLTRGSAVRTFKIIKK